MYRIIKSVIENKNFDLNDISKKINKMYIENMITEEEKNELDNLSREKAKAENSYDLQKQIDNIVARLEKLENANVTDTEETTEEYPEFKQPSGAHDSFQIGDKITYTDGKKYICKMPDCVWAPDVYPSAWEEVVESEG